MKCRYCNTINPYTNKVCGSCGAELLPEEKKQITPTEVITHEVIDDIRSFWGIKRSTILYLIKSILEAGGLFFIFLMAMKFALTSMGYNIVFETFTLWICFMVMYVIGIIFFS